MEPDANDIPCPDCGQPRPAGVRCPECGLPSEADAVAARLERVFFRRLRRAIAMCASVLALGTFLLMLWDVPQRDVLISAALTVCWVCDHGASGENTGQRCGNLWRTASRPQKTDNTQRLSVCWGQLVDKETASAKITRFRGFLGPQPQGVQ